MQEGKVITYESRKLKEHEQKYYDYDLELVATIYALKMWRHYLMVLLMMDHHSLNYFNQPTLNDRQARWVYFLRTFDFEIKHLKGKENWVANVLSQKVHCLYKISRSEGRITFNEMIKKVVEQDYNYQQIGQQVQNPTIHEYQ